MAKLALIPGDGIGPEVLAEGLKVLSELRRREGLDLSWDTFDFGAERYLKDGTTLPDEALEAFRSEYDAILLGALGDPRIPDMRHGREILLRLRFELDLFINLRPVRLLDPRLCPLKGKGPAEVDFVIFRENTEGLYVGAGGHLRRGTPDEVALQEAVATRKGVERIVRAAFEYAKAHGRRRLCMSDKSNAMPHVGGLWRRVFEEVRGAYPEIEATHLYVDVAAMELVRAPERFEVLVTGNLFGDILSDLGAGLAGGLGLAPSANLHPGKAALFEPVHGSAPDIAGTGRANPLAMILTVAMLLEYLGHAEAARRVERAVQAVLEADQTTPDLGGRLSTSEVGDAVLAHL
ncbi:MAG: 3-isopropylmalate dehydrogenase [Deltaproteobacteria bacterium]|nr:MAG: 3-isopropylmalate dehydrogenase [Deltaproteobacteria bacterium]